jgi:tRNA threonylcarbamoyladenosine biosynthesis protein TsaE
MTYVPLNELPEFVRNVRAVLKLLPPLNRAVIVHLNGNLGAGKTTFVQTIARDYGIAEPITSPTYTIMRSYAIPHDRLASGALRRYKKLIHIDAYRLESPEQWQQLKPEEFLGQEGTVVFIEWPDKIAGVGPKPDLELDFTADDSGVGARSIQMRARE